MVFIKMNKRTKKTIKHGAGFGLLGCLVGAPGLGVVIGVANANKDKIKKFAKNFDEDKK